MPPNADTETHCRYCGRPLVDVVEPDVLCDPHTGDRPDVVWRQCPRYPRRFWQLYRGTHVSFQRDNPIHGRQWR
jgi:hypothetical protein